MAPRDRGLYQCGVCKAVYSRADHLTRHVKNHMPHRPHACSFCSKTFARRDLLVRHEALHQATTTGLCSITHSALTLSRVSQACRACASKKLKCTEEKPCKRCKDKHIICEYQTYDAPGNATESALVVEEGDAQLDYMISRTEVADVDLSSPLLSSRSTAENASNADRPTETTMQDVDQLAPAFSMSFTYGNDLEVDPTAFDLQDMDFSFFENLDILPLATTQSENIVYSPISGAGIGSKAYRRDVLAGWEPHRAESSISEHAELSLPNSVNRQTHIMQQLSLEYLSESTRYRILDMIFLSNHRINAKRVLPSFPSTAVLFDLILLYFIRKREEAINDFVHFATFNVNEQRPELIVALIAAGAIYSPDPSVRQFGYALQEIGQKAVLQSYEEDHVTRRDPGLAQAFYIYMYIALWSGNGRKIELVEACSMLGATILRRGKHLGDASSISDLNRTITEPGWKSWVAQESMRRLAYFGFALNSHLSMVRNVSPLLSYAEMRVCMPSSPELWSAKTATEWQQAYSQKLHVQAHCVKVPSLYEVIGDPAQLRIRKDHVDAQFAGIVILAALWELVREYRQLSFIGFGISSWTTLVQQSRQNELCAVIRTYKLDFEEWLQPVPEIQLLLETTAVHLHVSIDDLHNYAGKESEDEAQRAKSYVERWFQSSESRLAIWHAGQVVRVAKNFKSGSLTDVYAIALFQAAVVIWVYGVMIQDQLIEGTLRSEFCGNHIFLDGDEMTESTRFLETSCGTPGITDKRGLFCRPGRPRCLYGRDPRNCIG